MAGRKELSGFRLACDGCHLRKLRCSRTTTACERCLRDGVRCVYSPSRKVGRPSKAEQIASRSRGPTSNENVSEMLNSPRRNQDEYSSSQQSEQEGSHTAFWTQMSNDGYPELPLESCFWSEPQPSGRGPDDGAGVTQYDNMTMTIGSEAFANEDVTMNQSLNHPASYDELSNSVGPKASHHMTIHAIDSVTLITPPREHSDTNSESSTTAVNNKVQRLSELQRELFKQRSHLPDAGGDYGVGEIVDVDAIVGTGQAIIELTRSLFATFATIPHRTDQETLRRVDWDYDPATMLLALTPSLLVVTTYDDVLALISAALDEISAFKMVQGMAQPWPDNLVDSHVEKSYSRPSSQPSKHNTLLRMTPRVGGLTLDFPLRLIISMSIIEYQLRPLERSLQLVHTNHFQSHTLDVSKGILANSIDGLRSAIEGLQGKVTKLTRRAKMLDVG